MCVSPPWYFVPYWDNSTQKKVFLQKIFSHHSKTLYNKLQHRYILLRHFKRFPLQIGRGNSVDPGT